MLALRSPGSTVIAKDAKLNKIFIPVNSQFRPMEEWENSVNSSGKSKPFILPLLGLPQDCCKDNYYKNGSE